MIANTLQRTGKLAGGKQPLWVAPSAIVRARSLGVQEVSEGLTINSAILR